MSSFALQDWYGDRMAIAKALRAGDEPQAREIERKMLDRGDRWKRRSVAMLSANVTADRND